MHVLLLAALGVVAYVALLALLAPVIGRMCAFNDRPAA